MFQLAVRIIDLPLYDDLKDSVDEVLRLAHGDAQTALKAVILGQRNLMEAYSDKIRAGYVRHGGKR